MQAIWAKWYSILICMVVLTLCGVPFAFAQGVIELDGRASYDIVGWLEMYREPAASLTIDDVLQGRDADQFQPVTAAAIALGQTDDAIWFRSKMRNVTAEKLKINWAITYIFLEQIDIYQVREGEIIDHLRLGKVVPYSARRVDMDAYVLPLTLAPGEQTEVYWRIKSGVPMLIPFVLASDAALAKFDGTMAARVGIYVGIMSGMAFYNLFLFFAIRDRAYLYYVLFIAFGSLVQAALLGVLDKFTPEAIELNRMNGNLFSSIALTFGILFSIRMLEIEHLPRRYLRIMQVCVVFFALCTIGSLVGVRNIHIPLTFGVR